MNDAERYQRDFDDLMLRTARKAEHARLLAGAERVNKLIEEAAQVGIGHDSAWKIVVDNEGPDDDPRGLLQGLQALQTEIERRNST